MRFDFNHTLNTETVSTVVAVAMRRTFAQRRALGQSVQFLNDAGDICEFSFNTRGRAVAFRDKIIATGADAVLSA